MHRLFFKTCAWMSEMNSFQILVDADACPVVGIIEKTARLFCVPVTLFCDTNHVIFSDYGTVRTVSAGADAVDIALANSCKSGDVVVTQDYGVAAMVLAKGARAIHQSGKIYTNENIEQMLAERYMAKKARAAKAKNHLKGPRKRTIEDDRRFEKAFTKLLEELTQKNYENKS